VYEKYVIDYAYGIIAPGAAIPLETGPIKPSHISDYRRNRTHVLAILCGPLFFK
jgi:hypothetical protein